MILLSITFMIFSYLSIISTCRPAAYQDVTQTSESHFDLLTVVLFSAPPDEVSRFHLRQHVHPQHLKNEINMDVLLVIALGIMAHWV